MVWPCWVGAPAHSSGEITKHGRNGRAATAVPCWAANMRIDVSIGDLGERRTRSTAAAGAARRSAGTPAASPSGRRSRAASGWTTASTRLAPGATAACRTWKAIEVLVSQMTGSGALNGVAMAARCTTASGRTRAKAASARRRIGEIDLDLLAAASPIPRTRSSETTSWPAPASPATTLRPSRPAAPGDDDLHRAPASVVSARRSRASPNSAVSTGSAFDQAGVAGDSDDHAAHAVEISGGPPERIIGRPRNTSSSSMASPPPWPPSPAGIAISSARSHWRCKMIRSPTGRMSSSAASASCTALGSTTALPSCWSAAERPSPAR